MTDPFDLEVSVRLPVRAWNAVLAVLGRGTYSEVCEVIHAITVQAHAEYEAAMRAASTAPQTEEAERTAQPPSTVGALN